MNSDRSFRLAPAELEYFLKPDTWSGSPTYEIGLLYSPEYPVNDIEETLVNFCRLIPFKPASDPRPLLTKTVFEIDNLGSIGFAHFYREMMMTAEYTLCIYEQQFSRIMGSTPGTAWSKMDSKRVTALHKALFGIINTIMNRTPLLSATVYTENHKIEHCANKVCVPKELALTLKLTTYEVADDPFYVLIDPHDLHIR